MPYEFTSSNCPAQDTDESPWEDTASVSNTNTAHADAEWTRLSSDFQNAGYREGITAGKEDALQEGFDAGFAQSGAPRGRELGLLRGLANAFLLHLSRSQAQSQTPLSRSRSRTHDQTESEERHDDREEAAAAAKTAPPLSPALREILVALTSVRFADIAPSPPPEEAEHLRVHAAEEGKSEEEEEEVRRRPPTGLSSSAGPKATTIEDVRALRVRLEALLRQAGLNVDLNLESLDP